MLEEEDPPNKNWRKGLQLISSFYREIFEYASWPNKEEVVTLNHSGETKISFDKDV